MLDDENLRRGILRELFHDLAVNLVAQLSMQEAFGKEPSLLLKDGDETAPETVAAFTFPTAVPVPTACIAISIGGYTDTGGTVAVAVTHDALDDLEHLDGIPV